MRPPWKEEVSVLQEKKPTGLSPLVHLPATTDRKVRFSRGRKPVSTQAETITLSDEVEVFLPQPVESLFRTTLNLEKAVDRY